MYRAVDTTESQRAFNTILPSVPSSYGNNPELCFGYLISQAPQSLAYIVVHNAE